MRKPCEMRWKSLVASRFRISITACAWAGLGAAFAALMAGCAQQIDDDDSPAPTPKVVAFAGKVDPSYTGIWTSVDGTSVLVIGKDGSLNIDQTTVSVHGKSTSHFKGSWLADGGSLLFQYADGTSGRTTLKYAADLGGSTLVLHQPGGLVKTTYKRR